MIEHLKSPFFWVRWGAVAVFLGRAWQHLRWDVPYRTLFWDEQLMSPIVRFFGMSWQEYTHNLGFDAAFSSLTRGFGVLDAACAGLIILGLWSNKWARAVLWSGAMHMCLLAAIYCKEHFYHVVQFLEFGLQVALPIAVLCWNWKHILPFLKLACSLTFICHGLYAVGYYPIPGDFLDMMLNGFGGEETSARAWLFIFGVADMVAAALIWLKGWPQKIGLLYLIIWGLLTTVARVYGHYHAEIGMASALENWWFHALYRFPHWTGPIAVWRKS